MMKFEYDTSSGTYWCPDCLDQGLYRELTINLQLCETERVVLQCRTCLHEEVFNHGKG